MRSQKILQPEAPEAIAAMVTVLRTACAFSIQPIKRVFYIPPSPVSFRECNSFVTPCQMDWLKGDANIAETIV
jgi:hypothetical protein